jgi:glucans biosynthesis protein C
MDALRAAAMLLIVPVHAASLLAVNGHSGAWATAVSWPIHLFRVPLFFAMSGFFLTLTLTRKGFGQATCNRLVRIAVPLAVGLVTLVPLTVLLARATGVLLSPGASPVADPLEVEPSYLWFLWYLLIIDGVAAALFLFGRGLLRAAGRRFRVLIDRPLGGILLLAAPTALALWPAPVWTTGAPATDTFIPEPALLVYYALFFGLGATLCANRDLITGLGRGAWRWSACAAAAILPAAALFALHNSAAGTQPLVRAASLLLYAIATWTSLLALVGLAHRYMNRPHPAIRYVADSAYWIYLSHMPTLVWLLGLTGATALTVGTRFALVTAGTLALSMLTYALFVRYTAIGRVLNGARERRGALATEPSLRGAAG